MLYSSVLLAASLATAVNPAEAQQPPALDRHFLDTAEYFIARDSFNGTHQYVAVGRMLNGPSAATRFEAEFLIVGPGAGMDNGQRVWTRWYWATRAAEPADASLGATVFCLNTDAGGVYQAPATRDEALGTGWWMATVTDVSDMFRQEVRSGEYRLALSCLRVPTNARRTSAAAPRAELDFHHLDTAEYFIAPEAISGSSAYVAVGRMIIAPTNTSRGEAQFLVVGSGAGYTAGQTVWTRHFWRTRQAQTADIRLGRRVWCLNREEDGVYQGPRDRGEALNGGWWTATIADLADPRRTSITTSRATRAR